MTDAPRHGYSATPLAAKLAITATTRVAVLAAPAGFTARLDDVPPPHTRLRGRFDVIVQFAGSRATLERRLEALIAALAPRGGLWIAWPKRSSGIDSDLDDRVVRETLLATGLVDNKVCAIDETWSGLRFVRRLADR
ncbi:MAG: DUF3052 domain-containing protein [Solirubrobacteraceae bacterium]|jgi:hypothetical protein